MEGSNSASKGFNIGRMFVSDSPISQVISGVVLVMILYLVMSAIEYVHKSFLGMWRNRVELFPDTYTSGSKMYTAVQNPQNPAALTVNFSENERSGIEFSYSMFINLNSATFSGGNHYLYHILHKGYNASYPLMGPGIFAWGDNNTIRVYMNCYNSWNNYTDIENIPVDKWFHLVVSCKSNTIYIYINGNLKQKVALSGNTPPYQNYGDVYLFNPRKKTLPSAVTTSLQSDPDFIGSSAASSLVFDGAAKGMASRVYYFSYALTYSEIQSLMNAGPSTTMSTTDMSISPYLSDTWWTNTHGP